MCSTCGGGRRDGAEVYVGPRRSPRAISAGADARGRCEVSRRGPRPLLGRGASNMSPAPALHHFIEALGLLRQLGEIDEVVPLLRHDQTFPLAV